jgi:hypothetical protein
MKPTKSCKKEGEKGGWFRKSNKEGVNLIKVHYRCVVNIIMKPLFVKRGRGRGQSRIIHFKVTPSRT